MALLTTFGVDIIETLKSLGYQLKSDGDLTIARTTDEVTEHCIPATSTHGRLDLKGVIFSNDMRVVAPGCIVPLEQPDSELKISHYSPSHDGILYRFYHHRGRWRFSTSGKINPNIYWGPKGTPTFDELCQEAIDAELVDMSKLNPNYCYYAVLESPRYTNFVKHDNLRLVLTDCVDCSTSRLVHVCLTDDLAFRDHEVCLPAPPDFSSDISIPSSLTQNDVGYTVHYTDGSTFRVETDCYRQASKIRPNLPDPTQQWIALTKSGDKAIFLKYFPWNEKLFAELDEKYQALLQTIVENYKRLDREGWYRVTVPSRHVKYMRDLMEEVTEDRDSEELTDVISQHLLNEDFTRICYLINPYNASPRHHTTKESI